MPETVIFERGDHVYLVAPVAPLDLSGSDLEELAFAQELKRLAPNENIGWLRGQYVEADRPNANGAMWSTDELSIKSLTPMLMPVTVMHDPRTAVGMIADAKLVTPDERAGIPRARIDTTLGVWRHRFPDVWEEAATNYAAGTLMQSMECRSPWYECGDCGRRYPKLPDGSERANWCEHLKGEVAAAGDKPTRRLGDVTFTGTGLIFGTRGARGALDTAHLDVFQDEVAEFHERAHRDTSIRRALRMDTIEIKRSEYDELVAKANTVDPLAQRVSELEEKASAADELTSKVDKLEIEVKAAEDARDEEKAKREQLEEAARADELATERLGKLGGSFKAKLPEGVRTRLEEQAKTLSEEAWTERLDELAELTGVKPDEVGENDEGQEVFSEEETARAQIGTRGGSGEPSPARRQAVMSGLAKTLTGKKAA